MSNEWTSRAEESLEFFDRVKYGTSDGKRKDRCPNCEVGTSLQRRDTRRIWPDISSNQVVPTGGCVIEDIWSCDYCDRTTIEFRIYGIGSSGGDSTTPPDDVVQAWPRKSPRELPKDAPGEVRSLFREGSVAETAGALRGAAALYRAAVEKLCDDQGAEGRDLYHRILDLLNRGVDKDLVDDLHEGRLLGNWSIHDGLVFSPEEVADVAELLAQGVHLLYVEPARRAAMKASRQIRREERKANKPG